MDASESQTKTVYAEVPHAPVGSVPAPVSLLTSAIAATKSKAAPEAARLERFLATDSPAEALRLWFGPWLAEGGRPNQEQLARLINRDIATIDRLLSGQVNAILHHPRFQQLESGWRGLEYLVDQADGCEDVKIRVLSVTWNELVRDHERSIEFDQSHLFRKVYGQEFDMPGGEPYGVLIGDYQIRHRPSADHPTDDISTLTGISHVAAAAFAPFITSADPALLAMDHFRELEGPRDVSKVFEDR